MCPVHDQPYLRCEGGQVTESTSSELPGTLSPESPLSEESFLSDIQRLRLFLPINDRTSGLHALVFSICSRLGIPFPVRFSILHSPDGFLRDLSDSKMIVCPTLHLTRRIISLEAFSFAKPHLQC